MREIRIVSLSLVMACIAMQSLTVNGIALFLPLIQEELGMSFAQAGMLSAAATLTYALGQIPAGYLADRYGPRRLFLVGVLGTLALLLCFAFIHDYRLALLNQLIGGAFRALMFAPGLALITSWFPPERRATAMGLYSVGSFGGNILLALIGPASAHRYGWRVALVIFCCVGIGVAMAFLWAGRETAAAPAHRRVGMREALSLFRHKVMWLCGALQFVRLGVVGSYNFWLPSFLVADRGLTIQQAGWVVGMCALITAMSNSLGGYVSDRLRNPPLVIGLALAVLACTSVAIAFVHYTPLLLLIVAVNAMFVQFYFGPLFFVPVEVLGQRIAGTTAGFSNLFANIGSLLFAYGLGVIKDHAGTFTWGLAGIGMSCVAGVVLAAMLSGARRAALAARSGDASP